MEDRLSLHLKMFNDKIKILNQTNSKNLTLSATEARNLHAEVFNLLTKIAELSAVDKQETPISADFDGGTF
jgi:hypothetical protein